ncbi:MAG: metallophosphoesterase [Xanthomonadales bacterium]|nr:metallophosphoesterase [Xanthomonadales bacterium]
MPTRLALLLAALLLAACAPRATAPPDAGGLRLRILHLNDHHSRLGVERLLLRVDGRPIEATGGSFPLAAALIRERAAAGGATLKLHAGDALTGDLFFTLFRGEADADLMNAVCFDAFVVGNHEFDHGDAGSAPFPRPAAGSQPRAAEPPCSGPTCARVPGLSPLAPAAGPPLIAPADDP